MRQKKNWNKIPLVRFIMDIDFKSKIIRIDNWPNSGIICYDTAPLLADPLYFKEAVEKMAEPYLGEKIDIIAGIEARGFTLASALAYRLGTGLVLIRKKGKLPRETLSQSYSYEYAANVIEINADAILPGQRVVLVDDILATGGTMSAAVKLVNRLGGDIAGISFLVSVDFMAGAMRLNNQKINYLINYS